MEYGIPRSCFHIIYKIKNRTLDATVRSILHTIDHLHYDVIRAKPDGSCSRPAETRPSVL